MHDKTTYNFLQIYLIHKVLSLQTLLKKKPTRSKFRSITYGNTQLRVLT